MERTETIEYENGLIEFRFYDKDGFVCGRSFIHKDLLVKMDVVTAAI